MSCARTSTLTGRQDAFSRAGLLLRSIVKAYVRWYGRRVATQHLASLDDRMLKDIGIGRSEIEGIVHGNNPDHHRRRYSCDDT